MARLNEPEVSMESIESLKRKFLRQNRDIARVNSTQAVRIRNLENEVSSLLSENLLLREQLSRYKLELEGGRSQRIAEHSGKVRTQLEEKLQELSDLINGLGHPPNPKKKSPKRGIVTLLNPNQSPNTGAWRNDANEQEGRLPAILEHKSYPRKTLERQEMLDMASTAGADGTDSPEIGPPPVSTFVDEDPVKIDLPKRTRPQASEETSGIDSSLSVNLEQRRKRKDSGGSSGSRRSSQTAPMEEESDCAEGFKLGDSSSRPDSMAEEHKSESNVNAGTRPSRPEPVLEEPIPQGVTKTGGRSGRFQSMEETAPVQRVGGRSVRQEPVVESQNAMPTVKTGGKRKLSVREDEENQTISRTIESPDDFKFTRVAQEDKVKDPATLLPERSVIKSTRELVVPKGATRIKSSEPLVPTTRKVLAPKSINKSPRKAGKPILNDESKPNKPEAPKFNHTRDRRERRQDPVQIKHLETPIAPPECIDVQPGPEVELGTPTGPDLLSPQPSQPLTTRADSRDTPPPSELEPENEGHRPSRRARGAVSYAEPNLRDKMRRPTKDLMDAVGRDDKSLRRESSVKLEEGVLSMDTRIKQEPEEDWNKLLAATSAINEGSPLRSKALLSDSLQSSITTHRKRRESLLNEAEPDIHVAGAGSAIAALLAETRKAKAAVREKGSENERMHGSDALGNGISKMEIHEYKDPSPHIYPPKDIKENKPTAKISRRYSTMPHEPTPEDSEASDMEATRKSEIHPSRRRQSALATKSSTSRNDLASKDTTAERGVKRPTSRVGMDETGGIEPRSERLSARRRSMML